MRFNSCLGLSAVVCSAALQVSIALGSAYDIAVLQDNPVMYLPLAASGGSTYEVDISGKGNYGRYYPQGSPTKTRMPNGDRATVFNGYTEYVEVKSAPALSVRRGGALTIEAWIRPDVLNFPNQESDGYVHWAGKGEPNQHEYVFRMYSKINSANRPNRVSGYVFNLDGGLGSGSYFQDAVAPGVWMHVAMVIQTRTRPGTVSLYKDGVLRKTTPLSQFNVTPRPGVAPLRIATRDFGSFFKGAIGKFAVYSYSLPASRMQEHVNRMR